MAAERCWNCGGELIPGNRFCTTCGNPAAAPPQPRYYASRYLNDPTVYVQEQGFWRSFGPGRASGGANGEIPQSIRSGLVEIDPMQGRQMVAARVRESLGDALPYVQYAGFWKRVAASIIDGVALQVVGTGFSLGTLGFDLGSNGVRIAAEVVSQVALGAASWLYHTLMESSSLQATLGKMALGIVVTDLQGRRISWGRANARYWSQILSALILGIGFLMAGFTAKKQALHDMIANTLVVVKNPYRSL